jgi:hypothetical protein
MVLFNNISLKLINKKQQITQLISKIKKSKKEPPSLSKVEPFMMENGEVQ